MSEEKPTSQLIDKLAAYYFPVLDAMATDEPLLDPLFCDAVEKVSDEIRIEFKAKTGINASDEHLLSPEELRRYGMFGGAADMASFERAPELWAQKRGKVSSGAQFDVFADEFYKKLTNFLDKETSSGAHASRLLEEALRKGRSADGANR